MISHVRRICERYPGDTVLSPFMGVGSEGVCALRLKRKFVGIELKESYWRQACRYLDAEDRQGDLLALTNGAKAALAAMPEQFNPHEKIEDLSEHFAECARMKIASP